jgi:hypothetical protein
MKSSSILLILFILSFFVMPQVSSAQYDDILYQPYVKSHWVIQQSDSVKIIENTRTHRFDTVFVNSCEVGSEDQEQLSGSGENYYIISIIGNLLSYEFTYSLYGGAHPTGGMWYRTINITSKKEISLDDLFTSKSILEVMLNDTSFTNYTSNKHPINLNDFISSLHSGCEVNFRHLLTSFAITGVSDNEISIQFGIDHGCEVMPEVFTSISIKLPRSTILYDFINQ